MYAGDSLKNSIFIYVQYYVSILNIIISTSHHIAINNCLLFRKLSQNLMSTVLFIIIIAFMLLLFISVLCIIIDVIK